jgi:hypothetical protein
MFGLEDKNKKGEPFSFDLENKLKDPVEAKKLYEYLEEKMQKIKEILRLGMGDQKEFDQLGVILYGYHSLFKVVSRCMNTKTKK